MSATGGPEAPAADLAGRGWSAEGRHRLAEMHVDAASAEVVRWLDRP